MDIDIKAFIRALRAGSLEFPKEIKRELPLLEAQLQEAESQLKRSPGAAQILIGQQILAHRYGELLAIRLRKWMHENYTIGVDDGPPLMKQERSAPIDLEEELAA